MAIDFIYNDGGRKKAGYKGSTGDCAVRSIAIASERSYSEIYDRLFELQKEWLSTRRAKRYKNKDASPRTGVFRDVVDLIADELGAEWISCSGIGEGISIHLKEDELPEGRIVCRVSKHFCAVVDQQLHDTYDCSRNGTRGVYGYWKFK